MAKGAGKQRTLLQKAFVETAERIDATWPDLELATLTRAAVLALLRRQLFWTACRWGHAPGDLPDPGGDDRMEPWWSFGLEAGCPLLNESLDPGGRTQIDPLRSAELAAPVTGVRDPGELYQRLGDLSLARTRKGSLTLERGRAARRRAGLFFTPDWMASRLSSLALPQRAASWERLAERLSILDPACGSGRLLLACLDRILSAAGLGGRARAEAARVLTARVLRGVDIDPLAVALAKSFLWLVADPRLGRFDELDDVIVTGDAIGGGLRGRRQAKGTVDWERAFPREWGDGGEGFQLVIGNPPFEVLKGYAKRQGLKSYVERIRKSGYDLALSGNLNTYRLFLERSLQLTAPDGRLAFVLPFGFLMDRTAAPLRTHMLRCGWIRHVEVYPESARAFGQVGQSVVLLLAAKDGRPCERLEVRDGTRRSTPCRVPVEQLTALDAECMPIPMAPADAFGLVAKMQAANRSSLGEVATGRVGEVDQTNFRRFIRSEPTETLLLRGVHLSPYRVRLDTNDPNERWLNLTGFTRARGGGRWKQDVTTPRVVQTGIVNMEAGRRLVAAEVPDGVYLGNSINYWVPLERSDWDTRRLRGYLMGLLNSTPMEWRFRLTSSNNNVNLYEIRSLPLPRLVAGLPAESISGFLARADDVIRKSRASVLGTVREITAGWGTPERDDRAVAMLIGQVARMREGEEDQQRSAWLDALLDHFVNWHLGMDEPDLGRMFQDTPARAHREA